MVYILLVTGGAIFLMVAGWLELKNRGDERTVQISSSSWLQYSKAGFIIFPALSIAIILQFKGIGMIPIGSSGSRIFLQSSGLLLYLLTLGWAIWASIILDRNFTHQILIRDHQTLCRKGPYRWVRHPLYLSQITGSLSILLIFPSWGFMGLWFFFCFFGPLRAREEERLFLKMLGPEYARYQQEVPMMIPGGWWIYRLFHRK